MKHQYVTPEIEITKCNTTVITSSYGVDEEPAPSDWEEWNQWVLSGGTT